MAHRLPEDLRFALVFPPHRTLESDVVAAAQTLCNFWLFLVFSPDIFMPVSHRLPSMSLWRLKNSFIVPSLFLMSFWPHVIFGSLLLTFDLVLTFEICMWPHLAMNSGKSMWKTLLHSCKTEIIRQIIENKTCGKNVSFLFFFFS